MTNTSANGALLPGEQRRPRVVVGIDGSHGARAALRTALVERTAAAAMLVVGSRGRGAFRGLLLGSVALHSVMHADCPVTVVYPDDRLAPLGPAAHPASVRA